MTRFDFDHSFISFLLQMMNVSHLSNNTSSIRYDLATVGTTPAIALLAALMVIGTIANGHVFGIFLFRYKRKSTYVTFVLALALIDLVVCVCGIPLEILDLKYPYDFFSEAGCKLFKLISATLSLSSIFTLALLSRDRFKRVCYPLKPQWTNSKCRRYIGGGVVLSFLISAPVLYVHGLRAVRLADGTIVHTCFFDDDTEADWNPPLVHLSVLYVIFIVCLFILIISYICIWIVLYRRKKSLQHGNTPIHNPVSIISSVTSCNTGSENSITDLSNNNPFKVHNNDLENSHNNLGSRKMNNFDDKSRIGIPIKGKTSPSASFCKETNDTSKVHTGRVNTGSHRSTVIPFVITTIFIVVFLPYLIFGVFLCLKEDFRDNMTPTELSLYRVSMRLIFVNNVVNCFVYGIFDARFQIALKEVYQNFLSVCNRRTS